MNSVPSFIERITSFLHEQRISLAFLLLVSFFVTSRSPVSAHSNTITPPHASSQISSACSGGFHFVGAEETSLGWGASATIGGYQPGHICAHSSAWSMVSNSSGNGYAQIGYFRGCITAGCTTSINQYFLEYTYINGGDVQELLGSDYSTWGGSSDTFVVYYDSSTKVFRFLINGNEKWSQRLDWSATQMDWQSERASAQDQVLGGFNHHTIFTNVQYLRNGAWHTINATNDAFNYGGDSYNRLSTTTSGTFWVWDNRYA
jgi:hypothetical protein